MLDLDGNERANVSLRNSTFNKLRVLLDQLLGKRLSGPVRKAALDAFFLIRRHANVYLDISGIPPKALLRYFPRLPEIAHKTLFGTDWPGPGVLDMKQNLDDFRALSLNKDLQEQILAKTALSIWPA